MADPILAPITTFDIKRGTFIGGACREFWMRIPGLGGAASHDSTDQALYYLLNPYGLDLVVLDALAVITTASANAGQINVGLANDAAGTGAAAEIFDTLTDTPAGVYEGTVAQVIQGGLKCIWLKAGTGTDSYLCIVQGTNADTSALRWNLFLKVIPYDDMIGNEGAQAALVTA